MSSRSGAAEHSRALKVSSRNTARFDDGLPRRCKLETNKQARSSGKTDVNGREWRITDKLEEELPPEEKPRRFVVVQWALLVRLCLEMADHCDALGAKPTISHSFCDLPPAGRESGADNEMELRLSSWLAIFGSPNWLANEEALDHARRHKTKTKRVPSCASARRRSAGIVLVWRPKWKHMEGLMLHCMLQLEEVSDWSVWQTQLHINWHARAAKDQTPAREDGIKVLACLGGFWM